MILHTPLCDLLGIRYPIMQAGMGSFQGLVTPPALVAAVSNAGGMGCLGGTGLQPDELRATIRQIRALTDKPFGLTLLVPAKTSTEGGTRAEIRADIARRFPEHRRFVDSLFERFGLQPATVSMKYSLTRELTDAQVQVALEERVPFLALALGDAREWKDQAREAGTRLVGLVGSLRNVERQVASGVDIIICQGSEAGGHVGTIATLPLLPQVVDAAGSIPVVGAGGIADGRGVAAVLALGAQAAWCGTVFLFAEETGLPALQLKQLEEGQSEDFAVSRSMSGKPARMFRGEVHKAWEASGLSPLPMPHQAVLMDDFSEAASRAGRFDLVRNPAGQVAGMLRGVRPAAQIVNELVTQAAETLQRCAGYTRLA